MSRDKEDLIARRTRVRADIKKTGDSLSAALLAGEPTGAIREFAADLQREAQDLELAIMGAEAERDRADAAHLAAHVQQIVAEAVADVHARLAVFVMPPAPASLTQTKEIDR
jgi:hypothetical protein